MEALQELKPTLNDENGKKTRKGISGSTLKIIAIITMLIDHIGATIWGRYLWIAGFGEVAYGMNASAISAWLQENATLYYTYYAMRMIGRVAFPIFCFLLVEGFQKTHNVGKYTMRLGIFALISEIPFDLALKSSVMDFTYQNVYFTLFIGILTMIGVDWASRNKWRKALRVLLSTVIIIAGALVAELLKTDYGAIGVLCIMALYIFRKKKAHQIVAGCVTFAWEFTAPLAFIPIGFYNGKRGLSLKYVFYAFYPVHMLILYLVCVLLGIQGYTAA